MRIVFSFLLISSSLFAFENTMSMQGFTGLINTPNAQILKQGEAVMHFDNQFDNHLRGYDYEREFLYEEDYIFGIGFLPYFEVQGRLTEARGYIRDLSANAKLQLPYHHEYLPDVAVGVQDAGGAANNYDNYYAVMDKELWFVRASVGYGVAKANDRSSKQKERMDGVFGGIELEAMPWAYLLAEHDGEEQHAGIRLHTPKSWELPFELSALVVTNLTNDNEVSWGFNLSIPLLREHKKAPQSEAIASVPTPSEVSQLKVSLPLRERTLLQLQEDLAAFGFENVRVGHDKKRLHVRVENNLFDTNDLDALGYVAGVLCGDKYGFEDFSITLLKNNVETLTLRGKIAPYRDFLRDGNALHVKASLHLTHDIDDAHVSYVSPRQNSSFFKPRLELSPALLTAVGTEVGVFDYLLSARANLYAALYDGLSVSVVGEVPVANSENFDEGRIYFRLHEDRMDADVVNAMVHQSLHVSDFFSTTSAGLYRRDYAGVLHQSQWQPFDGAHALKLRLGYFENMEVDAEAAKEIYLGSYRYYDTHFDLMAEATYGKYWYGDKGLTLELKRFFDDVAVGFVYQNTDFDAFAGARVYIPLTSRKLLRPTLGQIKGKNDFFYGLRSTINRDDGTNTLNPAGAVVPFSDMELSSYYLNRDRLSEAYVKAHLDRMREVFMEYGY